MIWWSITTVDRGNPAPVEVGSLSRYLWGFIHPRWCRISSINSMMLHFFQRFVCLSTSGDEFLKPCFLENPNSDLSKTNPFIRLIKHETWVNRWVTMRWCNVWLQNINEWKFNLLTILDNRVDVEDFASKEQQLMIYPNNMIEMGISSDWWMTATNKTYNIINDTRALYLRTETWNAWQFSKISI